MCPPQIALLRRDLTNSKLQAKIQQSAVFLVTGNLTSN